MRYVILLMHLIHLSLLKNICANSLPCPKPCYCTNLYVNCSHDQLIFIPHDLPNNFDIIDLSFNELINISANVFSNQYNLSILYLNNNKIKEINADSFRGLNNLRILNLCWNHLLFIADNETFCSVPQLRELYLCRNSLGGVPDICFITHLNVLDLSANLLAYEAKFPASFRKLRFLAVLKLNTNLLRNLTIKSFEFLNVGSIIQFECVQCGLSFLPSNLFQLFSVIEYLNLSHNSFDQNGFASLIHSLKNISTLTVLNISDVVKDYDLSTGIFQPLANSSLEKLILVHSSTHISNNAFNYLNHLLYLDLSFSYIKDCDDNAFQGLPHLKYLLLSDCRLVGVPQNLPSSLTHLNISNNLIRDGEKFGFNDLRQIEEIDMSGSLFKNFNFYNFFKLDKLHKINLADNKISAITPDAYIYNLIGLTDLNLDGNLLVKLDWSYAFNPFKCMENLLKLSIRYNNCQHIEVGVLGHLKNLRTLNLDFNQLKLVLTRPDLFKELVHLQEVTLMGNKIAHLSPGIFTNQTNLKYLDLRNNQISSWSPTVFLALINLEVLLLSNNQLSVINESSVEFWPSKLLFDLSENPFNCWCDLMWFLRWLNRTSKNALNLNKYDCNAPVIFEGKHLLSVNTDGTDIKCLFPPWKIYVIAAAVAAVILMIFLTSLLYRYQWYVKLYLYKCFHRNRPKFGENYATSSSLCYDLYISYADEDDEWVEELVNVLEGTLKQSDIETQIHIDQINHNENDLICGENQPLLDSIPDVQIAVQGNEANACEQKRDYHGKYKRRVFYKKRDIPFGVSFFGKFCEAVSSSRAVLVGVSLAYLADKRNQFELDVSIDAMVDNYGWDAKIHVIFVALENGAKVYELLPSNVRQEFIKSHLQWEPNDVANQKLFWNLLQDKLSVALNEHAELNQTC